MKYLELLFIASGVPIGWLLGPYFLDLGKDVYVNIHHELTKPTIEERIKTLEQRIEKLEKADE